MNPLQFNQMISHSSLYFATRYGSGALDDMQSHHPREEPTQPQERKNTSITWRIRLARHLTAWARRLDPQLNG